MSLTLFSQIRRALGAAALAALDLNLRADNWRQLPTRPSDRADFPEFRCHAYNPPVRPNPITPVTKSKLPPEDSRTR